MTASIRNCTFAYRCDRRWSQLKKTSNPDVKFCTECQKEVFFCHTDEELVEAIALNRCIAINVDDHLREADNDRPLMGLPSSC